MPISSSAQFRLLLWKNWRLQRRRFVVTAFLILVPVVFATLLLVSRLASESKFVSLPTIRDSFDVSTLPPKLTEKPPQFRTVDSSVTDIGRKWTLVFSPNTSEVATRIATETAKTLNMTLFPIGNELTCFFFIKDRNRQR